MQFFQKTSLISVKDLKDFTSFTNHSAAMSEIELTCEQESRLVRY